MNDRIRLQKYLAQAEICSRRAAETLIADGAVTVNGHVAELGQSVVPGEDDVRLNGKKIVLAQHSRIVLMMNKPRGYVCTNLDPHAARTVFQLLPQEYASHKLFCVGRLDKDSEGLLLITNDGDLANKIIHPSSDILKRYEVVLNREFDPALTPRLLKGVKIKNEDGDDEFLRFADIVRFPDPRKLEVRLKQGRKREIRRLFEVFGFFVKTLRRFQIGGLILKKMPPGDCRKLSQKEIESIFAKGGNAAAGRTEKAGRAALHGEKAAERKTSTHKKISTRTAFQKRDAQKKRERAKFADAKDRSRARDFSADGNDESLPQDFSKKFSHGKKSSFEKNPPHENVWQRGIRPHHKNARTRNYTSRRRAK